MSRKDRVFRRMMDAVCAAVRNGKLDPKALPLLRQYRRADRRGNKKECDKVIEKLVNLFLRG